MNALYTLKDVKNEYEGMFKETNKTVYRDFDNYLFYNFVPEYNEHLEFLGFSKSLAH